MSSARHAFSVIRSLDAFPAHLRGGVVAIGNFDGVHRGHQAVLEEAKALARAGNVPAIMMTFDPHPRTVFRPDNPVFRLTDEAGKARLAEALGLDGILSLQFTRSFADQSADSFIETILIKTLGVRHVVTGYDFHFGHKRQGTPDYLKEKASEHGFGVLIVDMKSDRSGDAVSSSRIRAALKDGDIAGANRLLGYSYFVEGPIIHGEKRGRNLGFPTANMALAENSELRCGVYAVTMTRADGTEFHGAASFGRRPTFDNGAPLLETHVFDFSESLYDEVVRIAFHGWLRGEEKFASVDDLVAQMKDDCEKARVLLSQRDIQPLDRVLAG
ncbi:bifunctional riboflavin kinase/FAD synthetase [Coralliovum pocilloporae]|uniref:bifunctional riboflavin kinase/FAD synthetase n=1 Tax=Coralliovum pocilloporae TaxID=3066369 RepID=UPI0033078D4B